MGWCAAFLSCTLVLVEAICPAHMRVWWSAACRNANQSRQLSVIDRSSACQKSFKWCLFAYQTRMDSDVPIVRLCSIQVGRNGTGKTTLLRALALHQIKGIPPTMQILHVEQEVAGDERCVLDAVLACDAERSALLQANGPSFLLVPWQGS